MGRKTNHALTRLLWHFRISTSHPLVNWHRCGVGFLGGARAQSQAVFVVAANEKARPITPQRRAGRSREIYEGLAF